MSISKFPGHVRSTKLKFSETVSTLSLKAKIFEYLRLRSRSIQPKNSGLSFRNFPVPKGTVSVPLN